ncbi:MAG: MFS transporter [bacterium]|nr:MFS transporter [bacterium]MDP3963779.1 MFS transporter [bacterium]
MLLRLDFWLRSQYFFSSEIRENDNSGFNLRTISMLKNRNLLIIALIAMVNMLGYGIIIPLLYGYSKKFGLSDFENGLLFASFSICQFIATPIIGRLSDRYGRRPMLLVSIAGTAVSFFMMAFAPNVLFLFLARMLDGFTAGNIPVAFAVISDSTKPEDRAGAFGLIGAAFSFGFIFGPAVASFTVGLHQSLPFIIAGVITVIAAVITAAYLPETNPHIGQVKHDRLFDFKKMWTMLYDPNVGATFLISLFFILAFSCAIIYGFQPFTLNVLKLTQSQNALLFTLFGIIGLITQTFLVGRITKTFGMKRAFESSIFFVAISFIVMYFSHSVGVFVAAMVFLALFNNVVQTLIPTILSREADARAQGAMMGLNASYQSIGMVVGPIVGGAVATVSTPLPFALGSVLIFICFFLSPRVLRPKV